MQIAHLLEADPHYASGWTVGRGSSKSPRWCTSPSWSAIQHRDNTASGKRFGKCLDPDRCEVTQLVEVHYQDGATILDPERGLGKWSSLPLSVVAVVSKRMATRELQVSASDCNILMHLLD
jgi:hypothetical protein